MSAPKVDVLPGERPFQLDRPFTVEDVVGLADKMQGRRRAALLAYAQMLQREHAVAELIAERDAMAKWIVRRGQEIRDHACAECVGSGDLVVDGWRCAYHIALARIGGAA